MGPDPQDRGPYEKKPSGHGHTQRAGPVRTRGGDGRLHARGGGGPQEDHPAHTRTGIPASGQETVSAFRARVQTLLGQPRGPTVMPTTISPAAP